MEFLEVASGMWPLWLLGAFMVWTAWKTDKNLLRVEKAPLLKFLSFLFFLTIYRFIIFKFMSSHEMIKDAAESVSSIPWQMILFVYWEDMAFALPLVYLKKLLGYSKLSKPIYWLALITMMVSFGSGHIYQGWLASLALSFYVPFSVSRGQAVGFGTIVLCHMMYDLSTLAAVRLALGI